MKPLILTGGRGTRLGGYPKSLLPFGTWYLIDLQLAALQAAGLEKPLVVVEHRAEDIIGRVGTAGRCVAVRPPFYGPRAGLLRGLLAAYGNTVLLVHGDVLFHPGILDALIESTAPCACLIGEYVSGRPSATLCDGRVVGMGYGKDVAYLGMLKLCPEAVDLAMHALAFGEGDEYMDRMGAVFAEFSCEPIGVGRFPVIDIDTQDDSLIAHRDIFPRVLAGLGLVDADL